MKHSITAVLLAGAFAIGGVACSEKTDHDWDQAGESTGQALESTGHDVREGTGEAMRDTGHALQQGGRDLNGQAHDRNDGKPRSGASD